MITAELTLAEIGLIAATRVLLGGGITLLLPKSAEQRKAVGWTLVGVVETSERQDVVIFTLRMVASKNSPPFLNCLV